MAGNSNEIAPSSDDAEVALDIPKNAIPKGTSAFNVTSAQGEAKSLSRGVGFVDCDVTPPDAPIVPKMMILILIIDPKADFRMLRCHGVYTG